jgi:sugar/nucleoside kinase (ribokinase family)
MNPAILCYGEVLVDLSQHGPGPLGFPAYEALPGGAPANVASALARWGDRVGISTRLGSDALGRLLRKTLEDQGVDLSDASSTTRPTTMAVVSLDAHGDRSFDILWSGTSCEGLPPAVPRADGPPPIFHFGSVSMADPEGRKNTLKSARLHRDAGALVSFDPNYRSRLWASADEARHAIVEGLALTDVLKISEEEVAFVLEEPLGDPLDQAQRFRRRWQPERMFVTLGPDGCLFFGPDGEGNCPAPKVSVVDTTGAGDCFMAAILHQILAGRGDAALWTRHAVAAGSLATTKRGGIPSIPTWGEVEAKA